MNNLKLDSNKNRSNYSHWLRRGFFSLVHRSQLAVFGFLNLFFMVRLVSPDVIGIWVLFSSVYTVTELIRNGFIRNPFIVYYVTAEENEKPSVLSASLLVHSTIAILISILMLVLATPLANLWNSQSLVELFRVYALTSLVLIPFLQMEYLMQSMIDFRGIFLANLLRMGLPALYVLMAFVGWLPFSLLGLVWMQLFSSALGAGLYAVLLGSRHRVSLSLNGFKHHISKLLNFGKYAFGTTVSSTVFRSTDGWMIGNMMTNASVAFYNPAIRIANLVELPTLSIVNLLFSEVTKKISNENEENIRRIYAKSVSLLLAIVVPLCITVFLLSDVIVTLIFGDQYLEAIPVLKVSVFYMLLIPFNRQFGTIMDAMKKPQVNFYFLLAAAGINVVLNYVGISNFGIIGAAYATVSTYLILFILNQSYLYVKFGIVFTDMFALVFDWYRMGFSMGYKKITNLLRIESQTE